MTKHSDTSKPTNIVVVDGSNIATEGRSLPSLSQLNDAVTSFLEEHPEVTATVVVDATFGHRIAKKEVKDFDEAIANNELVAPPAGAIGRGDAFVLSIANKVGARVLSNDSFQEFHGEYPWLFDEGRLIGGKPVPNIGWVFVPRVPVQGARSRKAQRDAKATKTSSAVTRRTSAAASQPMPVPSKPPPAKQQKVPKAPAERAAKGVKPAPTVQAARATPTGPGPVNDTLPFLEFVEKHPIGTSVNAEVESYSSHGAYAVVGDVRAYIPLSLMDDPPPRSARSVMSIGEALTLVVASFSPSRRSIDLAFPHLMNADGGVAVDASAVVDAPPAVKPAKPRKRAAKQPAPEPVSPVEPAPTGDERPAEERARAARRAPTARKAPAKRSAAKKAPARKTPAAKVPAANVPSTAKKPATKKAAAAKPASRAAGTAKAGAKPRTRAKPTPAPETRPTVDEPIAAEVAAPAVMEVAPAAKKSRAPRASARRKTAAKAAVAPAPVTEAETGADTGGQRTTAPARRRSRAKKPAPPTSEEGPD